jgi:hypothetical protein
MTRARLICCKKIASGDHKARCKIEHVLWGKKKNGASSFLEAPFGKVTM